MDSHTIPNKYRFLNDFEWFRASEWQTDSHKVVWKYRFLQWLSSIFIAFNRFSEYIHWYNLRFIIDVYSNSLFFMAFLSIWKGISAPFGRDDIENIANSTVFYKLIAQTLVFYTRKSSPPILGRIYVEASNRKFFIAHKTVRDIHQNLMLELTYPSSWQYYYYYCYYYYYYYHYYYHCNYYYYNYYYYNYYNYCYNYCY